MIRSLLAFIAVACLLGTVYGRSLNQATAAAAAAPAAPAAAAAAKPAAAAAAPKTANGDAASTDWQKNGYVPLPKSVAQPAAQDGPAAAPPTQAPALPPANMFGAFTTDQGAPTAATQAPTGTASIYDSTPAPAAYAAQNPTPDSLLPGSSSSIATATPIPAVPSTGPGTLGGDVPLGASGGGLSDSVFTNQGNDFNNRYVPSVGSATSSNDVLVKMIINAPEQQVAASGDALRSMLGSITNTPVNNIYVYQTRTVTNANGQPSLALQLLFKNSNNAERARVQTTFLNRDLLQGLTADVAKKLNLQIAPGSIQATTAVNDGAAAAAVPGAVPGMASGALGANGAFVPGAFGINGAAAAQPAAPPPANAAEQRVVANVAMLVLLLVAPLVLL